MIEVKIKRVSLHGIPDLGNIARPCSLKNEGIKRMLKIGGMIRMMGQERFDRMVIRQKWLSDDMSKICGVLGESNGRFSIQVIYQNAKAERVASLRQQRYTGAASIG